MNRNIYSKIELPVRGTMPILKNHLSSLVEDFGLSIVNKLIQEGVPRHRAYNLYGKQLEKMVVELEKGIEYYQDGIPRVLFTLNSRLRKRWPDFNYAEAEEFSAKLDKPIEAFIVFLFKSYTLGYTPADEELPSIIKVFSDIKRISITDEMTNDEYALYTAFGKALADFNYAADNSPEEKYRYKELMAICRSILNDKEYEWFFSRFIEGCAHAVLAEIFSSTEDSSRVTIHRIVTKLRKHPRLKSYLS